MNNEKRSKIPSECTSIIVGKEVMEDGSIVISRSMDWDAMQAINLEKYEDTNSGPTKFVAQDSGFKCSLPEQRLGYSATPGYMFPGEWGSAGFNSLGIGMSATESIFSSDKALAVDALVADGLAENSVFNIVLPYIHSAREGVERLGSLIEQYGSAEGFGVQFVDSYEAWYLENACGHKWMAQKMPDDMYFVTGNQSRLREYHPEDKDNYLACADLIGFAQQHNLYDASDGNFDFQKAYQRDEKLDTTYNYPRVWALQKMFSSSIKNDVTKNTFPVFAKPDHKITIADLKRAFRSHYDGTEHDPYLHSNPHEPYRPISIFRTIQTHLIQVRPELPKEIGCLVYEAMGMADLGVFVPIYQGVKRYPDAYYKGNSRSSADSAYWKFRKVMDLGMINYNAYAPIIKEAYAKYEAETAMKQQEMEAEYLEMYQQKPVAALQLLQRFSDDVLHEALRVADDLIEELFTRLTEDIQKEYLFHGA